MRDDWYDEEEYEYEADTPEAVLRCAVVVACCDGEFAHEEHDKVREVYGLICQEMTFAYNRPDVSDDYEVIAENTSEIMLAFGDDDEAKESYIRACGELITDKDLREFTLVMALRVAGADSDLAKQEFSALKKLAQLWHVNLADVLRQYL